MPGFFKRMDSQTVGCCIYCGSTEALSREHVLPQALGGDVELNKGSCESCRLKIHPFETKFLSGVLGPLRHGRGAIGKRKRPKKDGLPPGAWVTLYFPDGHRERRHLQDKDLPKFSWHLPDYQLPPLGVVTFPDEVKGQLSREKRMSLDRGDVEHQAKVLGALIEIDCDEDAVCRSLAKMAHGVAVAWLGVDGWEPFLGEYITGGELPGPIEDYIGASWAWQLNGEDKEPETANPVIVTVTALPLGDSDDYAVFGNIHIFPNIGKTHLLRTNEYRLTAYSSESAQRKNFDRSRNNQVAQVH